ncbi:Aquaporin [Echinococcus multilocularis]|uniref:Aquaporin n=1 Tax=Echinococcus multilocularis TaxID=6211 RepID=A0A087VZ91_ECHMU|nr:Aquaporin [Echinococcus multilocularis]
MFLEDLPWRDYVWLLVRIFVAELIGSGIFILPAILITSPTQYEPLVAGIAMGGGLYVAIWITYPTSGAHINPIISLIAFLNKHIKLHHLVFYWIAQLAGALLCTLIGLNILPPGSNETFRGMTFPHPDVSERQAFLVETLTTSVLVIVYLATIDLRRPENWGLNTGLNMALPLMFTVIGNEIIAESTSKGSMNPFRSLGPALLHDNYRKQWLYIIGPLTGALVGSFIHTQFLATKSDDSEETGGK